MKKFFFVAWFWAGTAFAQNAFQDDAFQEDAFQEPQSCPAGPYSPASAVGQFTSPTNVFTSNNVYTSDGTVGDTMTAYDFSMTPISGNNIDGILVEAEMDITGGTPGQTVTIDIRLSWNGGTSWTAFKSAIPSGADPEQYYSYGGTTDTWGRTWSTTELTNANFRDGIKYAAEDAAGQGINIDHVRITIYCSTPSTTGNRRQQMRGF